MKEKLIAYFKSPATLVGLSALLGGLVLSVTGLSENVVYTVLAIGAGLVGGPSVSATVKALAKPKAKAEDPKEP